MDEDIAFVAHGADDLWSAETAFLDAVANVLAARLDAQGEPAESGAGQLVEELVVDRLLEQKARAGDARLSGRREDSRNGFDACLLG